MLVFILTYVCMHICRWLAMSSHIWTLHSLQMQYSLAFAVDIYSKFICQMSNIISHCPMKSRMHTKATGILTSDYIHMCVPSYVYVCHSYIYTYVFIYVQMYAHTSMQQHVNITVKCIYCTRVFYVFCFPDLCPLGMVFMRCQLFMRCNVICM